MRIELRPSALLWWINALKKGCCWSDPLCTQVWSFNSGSCQSQWISSLGFENFQVKTFDTRFKIFGAKSWHHQWWHARWCHSRIEAKKRTFCKLVPDGVEWFFRRPWKEVHVVTCVYEHDNVAFLTINMSYISHSKRLITLV